MKKAIGIRGGRWVSNFQSIVQKIVDFQLYIFLLFFVNSREFSKIVLLTYTLSNFSLSFPPVIIRKDLLNDKD